MTDRQDQEKREQPRNLKDPQQNEKEKDRAKRLEQQKIDDVRWILGTPGGRRFFARYLKLCYMGDTTFHGAQFETFVNEGRRQIGLLLQKDIEQYAPEAYQKMMDEHNKENQTNG
jgi:hypothetical protein